MGATNPSSGIFMFYLLSQWKPVCSSKIIEFFVERRWLLLSSMACICLAFWLLLSGRSIAICRAFFWDFFRLKLYLSWVPGLLMRFYIHFYFYYFKFVFKIFIWLHRVLVAAHRMFSCGMQILSCGLCNLVPWPRVRPGRPALGVQSLSCWTTREVPLSIFRR